MAMTEVRCSDRRPCTRMRLPRQRKDGMAKSAARAACCPSRPAIPTPTSAAWIIATSFPPSPTAATTPSAPRRPPARFTSRTTAAFWLGVTRQNSTPAQDCAACSSVSGWWARADASAAPSTTRLMSPVKPSGSASRSRTERSCWPTSASEPPLMTAISADGLQDTSPLALPSCTAVDSRSPVSIQTAIPASLSSCTVWGTPGCRRSSMAVTPSRCSECSSRRHAAATASSRPCSCVDASAHVGAQAACSSRGTTRAARQSVRRPQEAYTSSAAAAARCAPSCPSARAPRMTSSAPLVSSSRLRQPAGRTSTLMHRRSLVKSSAASSSYSSVRSPARRTALAPVRSSSVAPSSAAVVTSTSSSGDAVM
mmetsp:Transcript_21848/g.56895  ORF Transcript_21848/g.56895 Transcript_21848/m.56895 type:complete len:368 (-) Transcript_21848:133-1236(-)